MLAWRILVKLRKCIDWQEYAYWRREYKLVSSLGKIDRVWRW